MLMLPSRHPTVDSSVACVVRLYHTILQSLTLIVMSLCYFHPSITLPVVMLSCHVFSCNSFGFGRKF